MAAILSEARRAVSHRLRISPPLRLKSQQIKGFAVAGC